MTVPAFLACPFCGVDIHHRETLARAFSPPRVWHEWFHPRNGCRLAGIVEVADETVERQEKAAVRWNMRPASKQLIKSYRPGAPDPAPQQEK